MIIYITTNLINNKIYVGQDSKNNSKYLGSGVYLKKALNKYGRENFKKEILEDNINNYKDLDFLEEFWIEMLNSTNLKIGYNLSKGALGLHKGFKHSEEMKEKQRNKKYSEEIKQKISESKRGTQFTEEWKNNISKATKGHKVSKKTREIISEAQKGNKYNLGKKRSEEFKKKISDRRKGMKFSESHKQHLRESNIGKHFHTEEEIKRIKQKHFKPVLQLDPITEEVIKEWPSIKEANENLHCDSGECARGNKKTSGGFKWKYKN